MTRSQVDVRRAVPADAEALAALYHRWDGASERPGARPSSLRPVDDRRRAPGVRSRVAAGLARPDVEVQLALGGGAVVGVLVLRLVDLVAVTPGGAVHVEQLWVDPQWRRRGVARALLGAAARTAERLGVDEIACSVPASGREVHRFLARLGFGPAITLRTVPVGRLQKRLVGADGLDRRRLAAMEVVARRRRQVLTSVAQRAAGT